MPKCESSFLCNYMNWRIANPRSEKVRPIMLHNLWMRNWHVLTLNFYFKQLKELGGRLPFITKVFLWNSELWCHAPNQSETIKSKKKSGVLFVSTLIGPFRTHGFGSGSLGPAVVFWQLRVLSVRVHGFRRENGARSRIQSQSRGFETGHSTRER